MGGDPGTPPVQAAILGVGDSITTTSIDTTDSKGWVGHLVDAITTAGTNAAEQPTRIAHGGADVFDMQSMIDNDLHFRPLLPHRICVLIGANDVVDSHGYPQDKVTWKTSFQYVINALHTAYPAATIYLGKSYRSGAGYVSRFATIGSWIDELITENKTFCLAGVNSYDVLDGHAEYMSDEVHPNHDGCVALGNAWKTLLGY